MDLFGTPPAAVQTPAEPVAVDPAAESEPETSLVPEGELPAPSSVSAPDEPEAPAAGATEATVEATATAPTPKEDKPPRRLPAPPPLNPAELRKAANQILPLFTGQDPGAKDCLKANRNAFRSAFSPEGFLEFEQCVKDGDFSNALEHLKKAAKRHGISV